ncbi:MAG: right-handed parallel beta-helix repeat-containing protein [Candidatus Hydrogenedentales bacterium]|jgi:hypothetical protein
MKWYLPVVSIAVALFWLAIPSLAALAVSEMPPVAERTKLPAWPEPAVLLHVAPEGSNEASGTAEAPFATLEQARDTLRALKKEGRLPQGGAVVAIHGGSYRVSQTFVLSAEDSGEASAPIRYEAVDGETPVFRGGIRIDSFEPVTDEAVLSRWPEEVRGKVLQTRLAHYGIAEQKPLRLGGFNSGLGFETHPTVELFFNGEPMTLARWPNEGFVQVAGVAVEDGHSIHGLKGSKVGRLFYEGERPARWKDEPEVTLYGYWFFGWADSYERVASIDTERHEFVLEEPYCGYGYRAGAPYYALNLLSEIDMPGEWYLDRAAGILYFYPPADPSEAIVELSLIDFPFVQANNVSHTSFRGLVWELGGANGIEIRGGSHGLIAGCTVRRCAGDGIVVAGGHSHTLLGCNVYSMGRGGMMISGGDRKSLTPGNHLVENCEIYELSRIDHTYTPAVLLTGVGNRVARNSFHDIASSAMRVNGNDHTVELNEIYRVVQESDDQGGADMWGDATFRGNAYYYNYWHHIGNQTNPADAPDCGQAGIRLDDAISGTRIFGNVFHRTSSGKAGFGGVQIHGGKDNRIDNNVFVDCMAAVSFSAWGDRRWREFVDKAMESLEVEPELYVQRYPELARLVEDHDINTLAHNLALNCSEFIRRDNKRGILSDNVHISAEIALTRDGRLDLQALTPLMREHGLAPIPFEEIGLYESDIRAQTP